MVEKNTETLQSLLRKMGKTITSTVLQVGCSFLWGLTLSKVWGWFVVPKFPLPSLGVVECMGLLILFSIFSEPQSPKKLNKLYGLDRYIEQYSLTTEDLSILRKPFNAVLSLAMLLSAYVLHLFL